MDGSRAGQSGPLRPRSGGNQPEIPLSLGPGAGGVGGARSVQQAGWAAGSPHSFSTSVSPSPYHQSQHASQQGTAPAKPIRRRMRIITSCLECRRRKLKCNKNNPCENCVKFSRECVYLSSTLDEAGQMRLAEIKEKVGSLERALEKNVARSEQWKAPDNRGFVVDEVEYESAEEQDPWPSDVVYRDMAYDHGGAVEGIEDFLDLGIQVGRMQMTDRTGELSCPHILEEIMISLSQIHNSGLQTVEGRLGEMSAECSVPEFKQPDSTYMQPSSGLMFGQTVHPSSALGMLLPTQSISDSLMKRYFEAVHPVAKCVHQPSFQESYQKFRDEVCSNIEPRPSTQAVMFAAMFSAALSLDENAAMQTFGPDHHILVNNLRTGVESALCQSSVFRTTRVEALQALVMYLIPLCRAKLSRAVTALVGAAIRWAECIGLHRDGEIFGLSPTNTHVRRLLWHQLCILDVRTAEAHGPRPSIRRDEYDSRLPANCEEEAIQSDGPLPETEDDWTPMTFVRIRFEINEMMRVIWADRRKLERRQILLTEMLSKAEDFRKRMIEKYEHLLRDDDPFQRYTKLVMHLLLYRLYAMVLQPYHENPNLELPPRLNKVVVMAGIMITEMAIQIENCALFRDWAWYFGAYSQYRIALLLAVEIHRRPLNPDAARIWACLEHVFELDRNQSPDAKLAHIFQEVWTKAAVYRELRKPRPGAGARARAEDESEQLGLGSGVSSPESGMGPVPESSQGQHPQHLHPGYSPRGEPRMVVGQFGAYGPGGHAAPHPAAQPGGPQGSPASDWLGEIDWEAVNALFPADPTTGEVDLVGVSRSVNHD